MRHQVISVEPTGPRSLRVRFSDGLSEELDFRESFFHGVFKALLNPDLFAKVHCSHGFVEWPGELDLAPDAMYAAIRRDGRWVIE